MLQHVRTFEHPIKGLGWNEARQNGLLQGDERAFGLLERQHAQECWLLPCALYKNN